VEISQTGDELIDRITSRPGVRLGRRLRQLAVNQAVARSATMGGRAQDPASRLRAGCPAGAPSSTGNAPACPPPSPRRCRPPIRLFLFLRRAETLWISGRIRREFARVIEENSLHLGQLRVALPIGEKRDVAIGAFRETDGSKAEIPVVAVGISIPLPMLEHTHLATRPKHPEPVAGIELNVIAVGSIVGWKWNLNGRVPARPGLACLSNRRHLTPSYMSRGPVC
jgi:hypothetical protein